MLIAPTFPVTFLETLWVILLTKSRIMKSLNPTQASLCHPQGLSFISPTKPEESHPSCLGVGSAGGLAWHRCWQPTVSGTSTATSVLMLSLIFLSWLIDYLSSSQSIYLELHTASSLHLTIVLPGNCWWPHWESAQAIIKRGIAMPFQFS